MVMVLCKRNSTLILPEIFYLSPNNAIFNANEKKNSSPYFFCLSVITIYSRFCMFPPRDLAMAAGKPGLDSKSWCQALAPIFSCFYFIWTLTCDEIKRSLAGAAEFHLWFIITPSVVFTDVGYIRNIL